MEGMQFFPRHQASPRLLAELGRVAETPVLIAHKVRLLCVAYQESILTSDFHLFET